MRKISADSHILEPAIVFQNESSDLNNYPCIKKHENKGYILLTEDKREIPMRVLAQVLHENEDNLEKYYDDQYEFYQHTIFDPEFRLKQQDKDGVIAEILYPGITFCIFSTPSINVLHTIFANYNDWLDEYCSHNRKRLIGLAVIPITDVEYAIKEAIRVKRLGYKGVCLPCTAPANRLFSDKYYYPLWQTFAELELPVSFHILMGSEPADKGIGMGFPAMWGKTIGYTLASTVAGTAISQFICNGILEKLPNLKLVFAEWDIGWVSHYMKRLDYAVERFSFEHKKRMQLLPSEYLQRQIYFTFEDDFQGLNMLSNKLLDNLLWANDYPHGDTVWPASDTIIQNAQMEYSLSDSVLEKVSNLNVSKLYKLLC